MHIIDKEIARIFEETVAKLYGDKELKKIEISVATNEKFGDFQTNFAMMNSKIIGNNPRAIAQEIVDNLVENNVIEKLEIAGPGFINIFLKSEYLGELLKKSREEKYDFSFLNREGDVVIDFSSPNIAKRMHIGHLRSTIIGDSIARIYRYLGYHVVADNHIGDWGTQFGKLIIGYRRWLDREAYEANAIEELERVCKLAQADGFVQEFPQKYHTMIVQGGNNVSGGQKQRLCIARALLKKPKILILDDSTSAVDTKTDALIRKAFREEIPDTTKIIIAQRVSSIEDADQIIVMEDGKINGIGTSEELLKNNAIYREVYESQMKGGGEDEQQ